MDCDYRLIVTQEMDEAGNHYTGYGIEAWKYSGTGQCLLQRIPDLFMSKTEGERFVALCNAEEVAPFHLFEVIDNMLAQR